MYPMFQQLKRKLIVSCQASPGDPLDSPDAICRMALAALRGGAAGLRINSAEHIALLRKHTDVPVIGIHKHYGAAGLHITPDFPSAAALAAAGASMIALDCTDRVWPEGDPWQSLIVRIHEELDLPVMADVATFAEAQAAIAAGADCAGTTLNGYTANTGHERGFNWNLLRQMAEQLAVPVIAEGHISSPEEALRALDSGAWCVVVGSAITRPGLITAGYVRAIEAPATATHAIGIDIGGTSIKGAVVLRSGDLCFAAQEPTNATRGRDAILAGVVKVVERILLDAGNEKLPLAGLGIATAGAVDHRDGSIFAATDNLPGWTGFPLRAFAEDRFSLPCFVVNDAQAAALSEQRFGFGRGLTDFVAVTLGTGIGAGIVSAGKLMVGEHGFAGTVGHTVLRVGGLPCNCGRAGCLEAYVSTAGLIREYRELGGVLPHDMADDASMAWHINRLALSGDPIAEQAYQVLSMYLSEATANLFNILDPQAVLLSGGLIEGYGQFVSSVEQQARKYLHFGGKRMPQVRAASAGKNAGIQGAASLVFASQRE